MIDSWPTITDEAIEKKALDFLVQYFDEMASGMMVPIPVEVIAEHYLGYDIEITNDGLFQDPDFLGGIDFDRNTLMINASIESHEGRYAFTIAHEIGHHLLHREHFLSANETFSGKPLCREQGEKPEIECQADRFAAALLMPQHIVKETFEALEDKPEPKGAGALKGLASKVILAGGFTNVSVSAMANRLIDVKLVPSSLRYQTGTKRDFYSYNPLNIFAFRSFFRKISGLISR
jgi:Zn-dependent peptidase ImmA (M78 family)